jgi:hypothetical protein
MKRSEEAVRSGKAAMQAKARRRELAEDAGSTVSDMVMKSRSKQLPAETLVLIILMAIAACARLPGLSTSFYGDEGFSLLRDSDRLITTTEDRFRPVFFSLLYLWKQIGFHGEAGLRLLPVLFGIMQVAVAFRLALLLEGLEAAVVFGTLTAVNPMLIEFSQELRMYSLVPLLALAQAWAFEAAVSRTANGQRAIAPWLAFVTVGVAGVYTHFHYWFLVCGFAFAVLRRRRELPLAVGALALTAIVLLYLPNVPNLLRFQHEAADAPHLRATDLPSAMPKLVAAICVGFDYFSLPHMGIERAIRASVLRSNAWLTCLVGVPALLLVVQVARIHLRAKWSSLVWMAHELFTVPAALGFAATFVMKHDFIHPKYMVFSAPFLLLLIASGFLALRSKWQRIVVAIMGLAAFSISIAHFNEPRSHGRREDWRGLAEFLRSRLSEESVVLWLGNTRASERMTVKVPPRSLWEYYGSDLFPWIRVVRMPSSDAAPEEVSPMLAQLTASKKHVYYVWSEISANVDDPRQAIIEAARSALADERTVQFNPRLVLYEWTVK